MPGMGLGLLSHGEDMVIEHERKRRGRGERDSLTRVGGGGEYKVAEGLDNGW